MKTTCITCGEVIEQRSSTPKLYCSDHCCYVHALQNLHSKEWLAEEKARRRKEYYDSLTELEQKRLAQHKKMDTEISRYYQGKPVELAKRVCHDCGKPCTNYRCDACWRKIRHQNGLIETAYQTESIWDDF